MSRSVSFDKTEQKLLAQLSHRLWAGFGIVSGCAFTIIGFVLLVTAFATSSGGILKGIQAVFSIGVVAAGILILRVFLNRQYLSRGVGILAGEIALACAFLYLGVAMPLFHQGLASPVIASIQFIVILSSFVFGTGALALSGASKQSRPLGLVTFPSIVRDGVILLTGTVLLAIAIGQLPGAALKPPQWNWLSFLGITIPGMLLLVAREGAKERFETWQGLARLFALLLTDTLLVLGLAIMLYGSYSNLTLGANGYQVGLKGNAAGLGLWIAAVLLLLIVRGAFKLAFSHRDNRLSYRMISKILYVIAVVLFIYGERSVISGQAPHFIAGGAAPIVALFLLGAFLVLIVGRATSQKVHPAYSVPIGSTVSQQERDADNENVPGR
jgi:hypothetical protein